MVALSCAASPWSDRRALTRYLSLMRTAPPIPAMEDQNAVFKPSSRAGMLPWTLPVSNPDRPDATPTKVAKIPRLVNTAGALATVVGVNLKKKKYAQSTKMPAMKSVVIHGSEGAILHGSVGLI